MDATAIVAIYAAVIATVGLVWQVYAWWHRRRSHVTVEVRLGLLVPAGLEIITVRATNRSDHSVRVIGIDLALQDGSGRHMPIIDRLPGATIPGPVEPQDAGEAHVEREVVENVGIDLFEPLTASVSLSTGELVKSTPSRLLRRS